MRYVIFSWNGHLNRLAQQYLEHVREWYQKSDIVVQSQDYEQTIFTNGDSWLLADASPGIELKQKYKWERCYITPEISVEALQRIWNCKSKTSTEFDFPMILY